MALIVEGSSTHRNCPMAFWAMLKICSKIFVASSRTSMRGHKIATGNEYQRQRTDSELQLQRLPRRTRRPV